MAGGTVKNTFPESQPIFKRLYYTYTWDSLEARAYTSFTANDFGVSTPDGYVPIGIWRLSTGTAYCGILSVTPGATGSDAILSIQNLSTSTISGQTAGIGILYMKSEYAELIMG